MKIKKFSIKPEDLNERLGAKPIICYPNKDLEDENLNLLHNARKYIKKVNEIIIPPRDAKIFKVRSGDFFRIESVEDPQTNGAATTVTVLTELSIQSHPTADISEVQRATEVIVVQSIVATFVLLEM